MAGILTRVREHLDALIALILAIVFSILGFVDLTSSEIIESGTLVTLAVLALALIRDQPGQQQLEALTTEIRGLSAELRPLTGSAIEEAFVAARLDCRSWSYRGGTGTYLRAVTLPELARESHRRGRPIAIRIQIIDPTDASVCQSYARHRFTPDPWPGNGAPWTGERARLAALATIVAACWYRQNYAKLKIELALLPIWWMSRYDLSTSCLLITEREKDQPAFLVPHGSRLYELKDTELEVSFDQGRQIPLSRAAPLSAQPTPQQVRDLFTAVGLPLGSACDDSSVRTIIGQALTPSNPYGPSTRISPVNVA